MTLSSYVVLSSTLSKIHTLHYKKSKIFSAILGLCLGRHKIEGGAFLLKNITSNRMHHLQFICTNWFYLWWDCKNLVHFKDFIQEFITLTSLEMRSSTPPLRSFQSIMVLEGMLSVSHPTQEFLLLYT